MERIFLLGGHDLEMNEIRLLLEQNNIIYVDRNLQWDNADLSVYVDILKEFGGNMEVEIWGVELHEKKDFDVIPPNYYRIDHHNDFSGKPASLLQVADILQVNLNRYQHLVAANDCGYIPKMLTLNALPEEIEKIRWQDRLAQGVTEKDEELAIQAIAEHKEIIGDLVVVQAFSNRFSPICDRLYPVRKLLIYNNESLSYYGVGKTYLTKVFHDELQVGKMYHGGGEDGFLGIVDGVYSLEEILSLRKKIEKLIANF